LGAQEGSHVIVPSIVCPAVLVAVLAAGATPVFCDVKSGDLNIDPDSLLNVITRQARIVVPVHSFGMSCDMKRISAVAEQSGCAVLEDFAQGFGNEVDGAAFGSSGAISITSFGREKLFDAGSGGALFTNDPVLYREAVEILRSLPQIAASWPSRIIKRLGLAWVAQSRQSATLRRRILTATVKFGQRPDAAALDTFSARRILELIRRRVEYGDARRAILANVIDRTRSLPHIECLAAPSAVLTMATFVLSFRPALCAQVLARAKGLFFLYRPLHVLYADGDHLSTSSALDGRLANISLSPAHERLYVDRAVSGLTACLESFNV
jgi:hypothetical protein